MTDDALIEKGAGLVVERPVGWKHIEIVCVRIVFGVDPGVFWVVGIDTGERGEFKHVWFIGIVDGALDFFSLFLHRVDIIAPKRCKQAVHPYSPFRRITLSRIHLVCQCVAQRSERIVRIIL